MRKNKGYWTKERCKEIALKHNTKKDFKKYNSYVYEISLKNKWLNEICSHMKENIKKPKGYWDKEKCHKEALKYMNKTDFKKFSYGAYKFAYKNKWLNEICSHMIKK